MGLEPLAIVDKRTKVQNVKLPINLLRWVNQKTVDQHRPAIVSIVKEMSDAELTETWQVMGEIGVILVTEMGYRDISFVNSLGENVR